MGNRRNKASKYTSSKSETYLVRSEFNDYRKLTSVLVTE